MAKMTIYVPDDLKRRMDEVEGVNWSPLACRAFESKLAEIISQRGAKNMSDVVSRLKASKAKTTDEAMLRGQQAGKAWASDLAEAVELLRLEDWSTSDHGGWSWQDHFLSSDDSNSAFGHDHQLAEFISGEDLDRSDGNRFWVVALGDGSREDRNSGSFLVGFVEGALAVWDEVKDQL